MPAIISYKSDKTLNTEMGHFQSTGEIDMKSDNQTGLKTNSQFSPTYLKENMYCRYTVRLKLLSLT